MGFQDVLNFIRRHKYKIAAGLGAAVAVSAYGLHVYQQSTGSPSPPPIPVHNYRELIEKMHVVQHQLATEFIGDGIRLIDDVFGLSRKEVMEKLENAKELSEKLACWEELSLLSHAVVYTFIYMSCTALIYASLASLYVVMSIRRSDIVTFSSKAMSDYHILASFVVQKVFQTIKTFHGNISLKEQVEQSKLIQNVLDFDCFLAKSFFSEDDNSEELSMPCSSLCNIFSISSPSFEAIPSDFLESVINSKPFLEMSQCLHLLASTIVFQQICKSHPSSKPLVKVIPDFLKCYDSAATNPINLTSFLNNLIRLQELENFNLWCIDNHLSAQSSK